MLSSDFVYIAIVKNGGNPKLYDDIYFDYLDRFKNDNGLDNAIEYLLDERKIRKIHQFNHRGNTEDGLSFLPNYETPNLKNLL